MIRSHKNKKLNQYLPPHPLIQNFQTFLYFFFIWRLLLLYNTSVIISYEYMNGTLKLGCKKCKGCNFYWVVIIYHEIMGQVSCIMSWSCCNNWPCCHIIAHQQHFKEYVIHFSVIVKLQSLSSITNLHIKDLDLELAMPPSPLPSKGWNLFCIDSLPHTSHLYFKRGGGRN